MTKRAQRNQVPERVKRLKAGLEASLKPWTQSNGITECTISAKYSTETDKVVWTITTGTENTAQREFEMLAERYLLEKSDFGRVFVHHNGSQWKLIAIQPRQKNHPILCENVQTGEKMLYGSAAISESLLKQRPLKRVCKFCNKALWIAKQTGTQEWQDKEGNTIHYELFNTYSCNECYHKRIENSEMYEYVYCKICKRKLRKSSKHPTDAKGERFCADNQIMFQKCGSGDYRCVECIFKKNILCF